MWRHCNDLTKDTPYLTWTALAKSFRAFGMCWDYSKKNICWELKFLCSGRRDLHYKDVTWASKITGNSTVCSSQPYMKQNLLFVIGIRRDQWIPLTKGQ